MVCTYNVVVFISIDINWIKYNWYDKLISHKRIKMNKNEVTGTLEGTLQIG